MKYNQYSFSAKVWLYPGDAAWHFVTVPQDISDEIDARFGDRKRGWGSLRVEVVIGKTTWKTSIFPDKREASYILPIKAAVRKAEHIAKGDLVLILLEILA
jgi:hypothetical protein